MKYTILLLVVFIVGCKVEHDGLSALESIDRYQLIQLGTMRRDQFMIDKKTGQIWENACIAGSKGPDCDYSAWIKVDVEGVNTDRQQIVEYAESMKNKKR